VRYGVLKHPEPQGQAAPPKGCVAAFFPIGQRTFFNAAYQLLNIFKLDCFISGGGVARQLYLMAHTVVKIAATGPARGPLVG
jgi:hypothetical protein